MVTVGAGRQMVVQRWQEVYRPAVRLGEAGSDGFHRSWIMLMPEGTFRHPEYGRLAFTRRKLLEFKRHFDAKVRKIDIALDRDHDAKAATGWLEQVEYRAARGETPAGLWGRIRWTSLGVRLLKEHIYRYFSPEFGSYPDEESGHTWENVLIGGALTNRPFLKVMPAVALRERHKRVIASAHASPQTSGEGVPASRRTLAVPQSPQGDFAAERGEAFRRGFNRQLGVQRQEQEAYMTGGTDRMGRRRRMGRARDDGEIRLTTPRGGRERHDHDVGTELDGDAPDAEVEDVDAALEDGAYTDVEGGGRGDGDADGTAGDGDDADDMDASSMGKPASHGASRRASAATLDRWEDGDAADYEGERDEPDDAVEGLTLRERRMAAQLAETRRQMATMHYRLYETAVDRVLAGWDRQTFQFSVIESRVRNPRGDLSGGGRGGATVRRQGMIGLSRAAREAIREVMLSEAVFRLSDDEREHIWRAFELALAGAVDLSARGGSFDPEERKTIRRGGPALSGPATEAALQEAAETLALGEYGKPLSRLTHEELVQVQLHAAEQTGYR